MIPIIGELDIPITCHDGHVPPLSVTICHHLNDTYGYLRIENCDMDIYELKLHEDIAIRLANTLEEIKERQ